MSEGIKRKLAAIVSADVAGYARLMGVDEAGTLAALRAHRTELIDPLVAKHKGRIVKTMGDGLLLEFPSVIEATQCSIDVQAGMAERNADIANERRITFRIGVNLGDVIIEGEDIFGDGINIAARLQTVAEPGNICISASVYEQITGKMEFECRDLGELTLKNIARPVRAYLLNCDVAEVGERHTRDRTSQNDGSRFDFSIFERPSIVVMPFKDLGGADQNSLADGLRLSLHSVLIKLSGLFLLHTGTVESYRGAEYSPSDVGDEIDVRYIVDGAVQRSGDRVRITIELTDSSTRQMVWGERYDRIIDDIFDLQDEIAQQIVDALDIELHFGERGRMRLQSISSPLAREYYHRGVSHFYMGTQDDTAKARDLLEKLDEIEPDVPMCVSLLALTHWRDAKLGWSEDPDASLEKAEAYARRALELGDPEGLGHTIIGNIFLHQRQHEDALVASVEALERRPSCPLSNGLLAETMQYTGKPDEAVRRMKEAMRLARIFPPWMLQTLASSLRDNGEIGESISAANEALRLVPEGLDALVTLCSDYSLSSAPEDAESVAKQILLVEPLFSTSRYAESQPYKDRLALDRIVEGLRSAGLPE